MSWNIEQRTGFNNDGPLSDGTIVGRDTPVRVKNSSGRPLGGGVSLSLAREHVVLRRSDSTIGRGARVRLHSFAINRVMTDCIPFGLLVTFPSGMRRR